MAKAPKTELDSVFFLKLLLYFLLGTFWLRLTNVGAGDLSVSLPVGLVVGLLFARHDHFQIDRKIEYAVLLISTVLSFYLPVGLVL